MRVNEVSPVLTDAHDYDSLFRYTDAMKSMAHKIDDHSNDVRDYGGRQLEVARNDNSMLEKRVESIYEHFEVLERRVDDGGQLLMRQLEEIQATEIKREIFF